MTHSASLLTLDALAVLRLTRLVVADAITAPLRARLLGRRAAQHRDLSGERVMVVARPRLAQFLGCYWCVSVWLSLPVTACQALAPAVWIYPCCVLAFSAVAGLLGDRAG